MKRLLILLLVLFLVGCSKSGSTGAMLDDAEVALLHLGVYENAPVEVESIKYFHITAKVNEDFVAEVGLESIDTYAFYIAYKVEGSTTTKYAFVTTLEGKIDGHEEFTSLTAFEADYEATLEQLEDSLVDEDFLEAYLDFDFTKGDVDDNYFSGIEPDQDDIDNAPSIFDDAINLAFNTNTTVTFTATTEERVYKFIPSETGSYTIFSTGDDDSYVELYDEDKVKLDDADDTLEGYSFSLTYTLTEDEIYYFVVGDYEGDDTYIIKIIMGTEPENVFDSATAISVNQNKTINITSSNSEEYLSFVAPTTATYSIYTQSPYFVTIIIYNAAGSMITQSSGQADEDNVVLSYNLTQGLTYYYKILTPNDTTATVVISMVEGYGPTTGPFTATPISVGQTLTANIGDYGTYVYFSFTPTITDRYVFYSISTSTSVDPYVALLNSSSVELDDDDDMADTYFDFLLGYYLEAGQTYYYQVGAYNSDVSFEVRLIVE